MHFDIVASARGVSPQAALQWWSDFQDGRSDHAFVPGQRRRVIERGHEGATMEDELRLLGLRLFHERTVARVLADRIEFEGTNSASHFSGSYVFEPRGNGTRIRLVADVHLRSGLSATRLVAQPIARMLLGADLRAHARELVAHVTRARSPPPS